MKKYVSITYAKLKELEEKAIIDPYSLKLSVKEEDLMSQVRTSLGLSESNNIPVLNEPEPTEQKMSRIRVWHETASVVFNCSHMPLRTNSIPGVVWIGVAADNPSGKALVEVNLSNPELVSLGITDECFKGKGKCMFYKTRDVRNMMGYKTDGPVIRRFGGEGEHLKLGNARRYPIKLVEQKVTDHWNERVETTNPRQPFNLVNAG